MKNILKYTLTIFGLFLVFALTAQPGSPPATPIDGGLSLLLAAGGVYGVKKLKDNFKSR